MIDDKATIEKKTAVLSLLIGQKWETLIPLHFSYEKMYETDPVFRDWISSRDALPGNNTWAVKQFIASGFQNKIPGTPKTQFISKYITKEILDAMQTTAPAQTTITGEQIPVSDMDALGNPLTPPPADKPVVAEKTPQKSIATPTRHPGVRTNQIEGCFYPEDLIPDDSSFEELKRQLNMSVMAITEFKGAPNSRAARGARAHVGMVQRCLSLITKHNYLGKPSSTD